MPILYTLISYRSNALVEHIASGFGGNFVQTSRKILDQIDEKIPQQSFKVQEYIFNCVTADEITYMCMTDAMFDRKTSFEYLNSIRRQFMELYGLQAKSAISYAFNSEFIPVIEATLRNTAGAEPSQTLQRINSKVKELKGVMADNIGIVLRRGEKVDLLVQKSEVLDVNAGAFRRNATTLQRAMYWKNIQTYVLFGSVVMAATQQFYI